MTTIEMPDEESGEEVRTALGLETHLYSAADVQKLIARAREEGRASGMRTADRRIRTQEQAYEIALTAARKEAVTDRLTGLPNRAYLDAQIEHECALAGRNMMPLMVAMIDIDHFKHINDTHGHQAGDEVLRQIARAATTGRKTDTLCRYGGEEFLLILPQNREEWRAGTYQQGANSGTADYASGAPLRRIEKETSDALEGILHRVRLQIANACVQYEGKKIPVTASIGGTVYLPTGPAKGSEIIKEADRNLYIAKHDTGRNTVIVSVYTPARTEPPTTALTTPNQGGLIYPIAA